MAGALIFALILGRAVWHKAADFPRALGHALGYEAVPERAVALILRGLIGLEVLACAALLLPATRPFGALLAACLFAGYGLLMARAVARGQTEIDCGCGGRPVPVSRFTLARNAALTALSLATATLTPAPLSLGLLLVSLGVALTIAAQLALAETFASYLPNIARIQSLKEVACPLSPSLSQPSGWSFWRNSPCFTPSPDRSACSLNGSPPWAR